VIFQKNVTHSVGKPKNNPYFSLVTAYIPNAEEPKPEKFPSARIVYFEVL
jgi:hypothetical protein